MTLHLVKLCVGAGSVDDMIAWTNSRLAEKKQAGLPAELKHTTRMVPKRVKELLDGGSLYWVIKGSIQLHQPLLDIRPFIDKDGIRRCDLVFEPRLLLTHPQPRRAFQGWRYLEDKDAPSDLPQSLGDEAALPRELQLELANLGLL